ncbi:MAG: hypothetical protein OXF08_10745 [Bacteroidetes bacterium]|nr:hypothetical protein [Bacteroidota bacterium]
MLNTLLPIHHNKQQKHYVSKRGRSQYGILTVLARDAVHMSFAMQIRQYGKKHRMNPFSALWITGKRKQEPFQENWFLTADLLRMNI